MQLPPIPSLSTPSCQLPLTRGFNSPGIVGKHNRIIYLRIEVIAGQTEREAVIYDIWLVVSNILYFP
jgi:hypothetical protein